MNSMYLNVLQVYYEPAPAGQTKHVFALADALSRHGHTVTVVMPDNLGRRQLADADKSASSGANQASIVLVPLPMRKLFWPWESVLALWRLVRDAEPDIVHVHSLEAGLCGRLTSWLASRSRRNSTHIAYTPQTIDIRRARWHVLYRLLERFLGTFTDAVISVNRADRQRLLRWGIPPHKVVAIHNGVELGALGDYPNVASARQSLGLDVDRPLVMQVARLSAQKDPLAFVQGAALVVRRRPDAQFALVGQGPMRDAVASCIQALGLGKHVHLLGWRDQAHRLMAAADIVTLTSRWEGSPYSLLEAMAASRPVVATAVNGCPEIVADRETGLLVPPGDVPAWAARVAELLNRPALAAEMGVQGRRRAEQLFSVQTTTRHTEQLYRSLAKGEA
jgi:glycosyltransferase involved in cell wall biosynthesis